MSYKDHSRAIVAIFARKADSELDDLEARLAGDREIEEYAAAEKARYLAGGEVG